MKILSVGTCKGKDLQKEVRKAFIEARFRYLDLKEGNRWAEERLKKSYQVKH